MHSSRGGSRVKYWGKTKKLTTFLVVALKTIENIDQNYQISHSINPPRNAPCISVCWFYYCILLL